VLAGWGFLTMLLVACFVPESNKAHLQRRKAQASGVPLRPTSAAAEDEKRSLSAKLCEMFSSVPFTALTVRAASGRLSALSVSL
jgi:hypothetical protein